VAGKEDISADKNPPRLRTYHWDMAMGDPCWKSCDHCLWSLQELHLFLRSSSTSQ